MAKFERERRLFVRIPLDGLAGTVQVVEVGGRPIKTEPKACSILNASGGGLRIIYEDDLQIRRGVEALFAFTVNDQPFEFRGTFIHKLDDLQRFEYGIRFADTDVQKRSHLVNVLGNLSVPVGALKR